MKDIETVSLLNLLPDSISSDDKVRSAALAIDPQLRLSASKVDLPSVYVSIDKLTSEQLDHIAVSWDVTVWRDYWPLEQKRSVLKTAILEKRKKGTVQAVRNALEPVLSPVSITEWWQTTPRGTPHTFRVQANQSDIPWFVSDEVQRDAFALIDDAKPLRSHYDLVIKHDFKAGINAYGCIRPVAFAKVYNDGVLRVKAGVNSYASLRPVAFAKVYNDGVLRVKTGVNSYVSLRPVAFAKVFNKGGLDIKSRVNAFGFLRSVSFAKVNSGQHKEK